MNIITAVRRLAILVGSQFPDSNFLRGVKPDLENVKQFLLSPCGGAWQENEIYIFYNRPAREVLQFIERMAADYCIIYFSGHGSATGLGERLLAVTDWLVDDLYMLECNTSPRITMLSDSCRTVPGAAISGIPWPHEEWLYADGYSRARAVFDQSITDSPEGRIIVHATVHGRPAYDNRHGDGGEFTLSLLQAVSDLQKKGAYGAVYLETAVQEAALLLAKRGIFQSPAIAHREGHLQVPFAQTSPTYTMVGPRKAVNQSPGASYEKGPANQPLKELLTVGGIALGVYLLSRL